MPSAESAVTPPPPLGRLRAAFERTGSPAWLMERIQALGLDRARGFELCIDYGDDQWRQGRQATAAALVDGEVDFIDTDWLSLLRCRRQGHALTAVYPYGRILGGLVAAPGSPVTDLADLGGRTLGIVDRRDKNWQLLCLYSREVLGRDLEASLNIEEAGSKTRLHDWVARGSVAAGLVYWHQIATLEALGGRLLLDIPQLLPALDSPMAPTTFFIFREALVRAQPQRVQAFIGAYREALVHLDENPSAWTGIGRRQPGLGRGEGLQRQRQRWRQRIAAPWTLEDIRRLVPLSQRLCPSTGDDFEDAFCWPLMASTTASTQARARPNQARAESNP